MEHIITSQRACPHVRSVAERFVVVSRTKPSPAHVQRSVVTFPIANIVTLLLREHMLGLYQGLMQFRGKSLFFAKVKSE